MTDKNYVFYDLETNGLDYYTTGIMQISVVDIYNNVLLNEYVYPYDNRVDCSHIHGIDADVLSKNNALTTYAMLHSLKNKMEGIYKKEDVYFIAYNNFGYDQIILENNFKLCNINIPFNWYFTDLLPLIKELYPTIKPNYKLKTVHENIVNNQNNNISYHTSMGDVLCMYEIFKKITSEKNIDDLLSKYTRSLLHSEKIKDYSIIVLGGNRNNITIRDILDIYQNEFRCNNIHFENYLRYYLKINNYFNLKNMIKQIVVINHFLEKKI
jgi:DNA polymerase III alpha subunit (gram-positive type)